MYFNPVLGELWKRVRLTVRRQCHSLAAGVPVGNPVPGSCCLATPGSCHHDQRWYLHFQVQLLFQLFAFQNHSLLLCVKTFSAAQNYCVSDGNSYLALVFNRIFHSLGLGLKSTNWASPVPATEAIFVWPVFTLWIMQFYSRCCLSMPSSCHQTSQLCSALFLLQCQRIATFLFFLSCMCWTF